MITFGVTVLVLTLLAGALLSWRMKAYYQFFKYDPAQDYATSIYGADVDNIALPYTAKGFSLPSHAEGAVSGFIELIVESTLLGWLDDPRVTLEAGDFKYTQYFERGARGRRFLNISSLLLSSADSNQDIVLRGRGLRWRGGRLLICRERLRTEDRLVVVAPHPDDAEIAAFGLYSRANSTVVTVTAGDNSDRFDGQSGGAVGLPRTVVAKLRVWDSIFIPAFGGVPAKRALNLCYPDGQLAKMHANPTSEFGSRSGAHIDYKALRQLNTSELLDDVVPPRGSWESLVHDLASVFSRVQPSVIVAPLPLVDPNPDHGLTTTAVCEALRRCDLNGVRLFLYVIHNQWTELYPFGPAGSGVSLPPTFDPESIECDALYSLSLSSEQQMWKCLALQAMHDLGDFTLAATPSSRAQWRSLKSSLGARLKGLSNPPTSYMRRAVRPDEVFFVLNLEQAERLARVHTQQLQEVHR